MKSLILGGALVALALPVCATAASPFDGTWKVDPASITSVGKPTVFLLADGEFSCSSCVPPYKIKADGAPHPYAQPEGFIDTLSMKATDEHTVDSVGSKGAKKMGEQTWTVSPDGQTLTMHFIGEPLKAGAPPTDEVTVFTRVSAGPTGSHAVSGTWKRSGFTSMSASEADRTFKVTGAWIDWTSGDGVMSYHAMAGGKAVTIEGDPSGLMAKLTKLGPRKLVETDYRKGKKTEVDTYTVSPDGKTMTIVEHFLDTGRITTETATKL